jgi:excisionase family DNA binding protein
MNTESNSEPLFLSLPPAAAAIGVEVRTVRKAIDAGQLPARRIGKRLLISRRTIEKLAAETE